MNTSGDVPTSQKYPGWSPEALGDVPASQLKYPDLILTHSWRCHSVSSQVLVLLPETCLLMSGHLVKNIMFCCQRRSFLSHLISGQQTSATCSWLFALTPSEQNQEVVNLL